MRARVSPSLTSGITGSSIFERAWPTVTQMRVTRSLRPRQSTKISLLSRQAPRKDRAMARVVILVPLTFAQASWSGDFIPFHDPERRAMRAGVLTVGRIVRDRVPGAG